MLSLRRGLAAFLLILAGCGSGGEASPDALMVGTYWVSDVQGSVTYELGQMPFLYTCWGPYTSDGRGGHVEALETSLGSLGEVAGTHHVSGSHEFWSETGAVAWSGGVGDLGRCAVAHYVSSRSYSRIAIWLSTAGAHTTSSLSGAYHLVGFEADPYPGGNAILACTPTFDGAGGYGAPSVSRNRAGTLMTETPPPGLLCGVAADGRLDLVSIDARDQLKGWVLAGGEVVVAAGGVDEFQGMMIYALVKAGSGRTDAVLDGSYWVVMLRRESTAYRSLMGTLTADGSGGFTFAGEENVESDIHPASTFASIYVVDGDGTLAVVWGDGAGLRGGVTGDGRYLALAGGVGEGDDAVFLFGVRR